MTEMYLEFTRLFFIVGGFMALILGVFLWTKPESVARMSATGNKWFSGRKTSKPLDIMHDTDGFYFAHHGVMGTVMFLASLLALFLVITRMPNADSIIAVLGEDPESISLGIFLEAIRWVLIVVILLGLPMWAVLALAPEKLKAINKSLNRWVSTRLLLLPLEKMHLGFDGFVFHHSRVFSVIFILGALFILFKFLAW